MKIRELKTFVVGNPPPRLRRTVFHLPEAGDRRRHRGRRRGLCRDLRPSHAWHDDRGRVRAPCARQRSLPHRDLWRNVYGRGYIAAARHLAHGRHAQRASRWPAGTSSARRSDKPVYELLGGKVHERLRTYTYLYPRADEGDAYSDAAVYRDPELAAERAAEYVAQGFTAVKFDPAGAYCDLRSAPAEPGAPRALRELLPQDLREAVGTQGDLLFGTHGQFTVSGALRLARRIEPYDPLWFEEPTPPEMPEEMAQVARQTTHPDRHRRAADHQIRIRPRAASWGRPRSCR